MHELSYNLMSDFVKRYLDPSLKLSILDVGSYDVNGNYKALFQNENWNYTGLDIEAGPNVDIVSPDPYSWNLFSDFFDIVISGQCLEHVEDSQAWIKETARVLRPGGILCVIAPWAIPEHRYPLDCWRILPDGMRFLLGKIAKLEVIEVAKYGDHPLGDCIGIAKKI